MGRTLLLLSLLLLSPVTRADEDAPARPAFDYAAGVHLADEAHRETLAGGWLIGLGSATATAGGLQLAVASLGARDLTVCTPGPGGPTCNSLSSLAIGGITTLVIGAVALH